MNFINQIERIKQVNRCIKYKATGNPEEFSAKLNISRRQLFRIIEGLKESGAPIEYSRSLRTFYYKDEDFEIKVNFSLEFINKRDQRGIFGGCFQNNSFSAIIWHGRTIY